MLNPSICRQLQAGSVGHWTNSHAVTRHMLARPEYRLIGHEVRTPALIRRINWAYLARHSNMHLPTAVRNVTSANPPLRLLDSTYGVHRAHVAPFERRWRMVVSVWFVFVVDASIAGPMLLLWFCYPLWVSASLLMWSLPAIASTSAMKRKVH